MKVIVTSFTINYVVVYSSQFKFKIMSSSAGNGGATAAEPEDE